MPVHEKVAQMEEELNLLRSEREMQRLRDIARQPASAPQIEAEAPPPYTDVIEPKRRHRWVNEFHCVPYLSFIFQIHRIALVKFLLGAAMLAVGMTCVAVTPYCPYGSGNEIINVNCNINMQE
jgi:hypothetical protein